MLQAHSPLWYYLWLAPNLLLLILAVLIWRRKLQKQYPVFLIFAVVTAVEQFALCAADVIPSVTATTWWYVFWVGLLAEALIKFALIGEIFGRVFGLYSSLAKFGKLLISGVGVVLVFVATVVAVYTSRDNIHWIISGAHVLEQTIYLIECGLIFFLFLFAAYFELRWNRSAFGIALGLGISACVHLATWALMAGAGLSVYQRNLLNFLNMATYHVCVLVWFYYLLVPTKNFSKPEGPKLGDPPAPEHNLDVWNQELERLIHQ
jgi:hypothetical protein